jgi:hypothetical protein
MDCWKSVTRGVDTRDWCCIGSSHPKGSAEAALYALIDTIPGRQVHHANVWIDSRQTWVFLQALARTIAEHGASNVRVITGFHGPSSWSAFDGICMQGLRASGHKAGQPLRINGAIHGEGVYIDRSGNDQGQGTYSYGKNVDGSILVFVVAVFDQGVLPERNSGSTLPVLAINSGPSSWIIVKDPRLILSAGHVCHTPKGENAPYTAQFILDRYLASTIQHTVQMDPTGNFEATPKSINPLPEICVGVVMLPAAGSNIPSQQGGNVVQIGGLGTRKSLLPSWDIPNLKQEIDPSLVNEEKLDERRYDQWRRRCLSAAKHGTPMPDLFVPTGSCTGPWTNQDKLNDYYQKKLSAQALRLNTAAPAVLHASKSKSHKSKPKSRRVKRVSRKSKSASAAPLQTGNILDFSDEDDPPSKRPKAHSIPTASAKSASAAPLQPGTRVNSSAPSAYQPSDSSDDDNDMDDDDY